MSPRALPLVSRSVVGKVTAAIVAGLLSALVDAAPPSASSTLPSVGLAGTPQEAGSGAPQVTIQAESKQDLERRAKSFVQRLVRSGRFYDESLSRWRSPLCFEVAGLPKAQGDFVLTRLSGDASAAGIRLAGDPCQPNFIVILTSQSDAFIKALQARSPRMFGDAPRAQIQRFLHPSERRVVRVWYNADWVGSDGTPLSRLGTVCGGVPISWMTNEIPTSCTQIGSHLQRSNVIGFLSVIVVVDRNHAGNSTFGQLSDYIAMVGLADIDPDEDYGDTPTILSLFNPAGASAPPGLTPWDQAFLGALYRTDQTSRTQRSAIVTNVVQSLSH